jgi:hypothetical protein
MMNLKLLTSLNVACCDECLLQLIDDLSAEIEDGILAATTDLDTITALHLTEAGWKLFPPTLPSPDFSRPTFF